MSSNRNVPECPSCHSKNDVWLVRGLFDGKLTDSDLFGEENINPAEKNELAPDNRLKGLQKLLMPPQPPGDKQGFGRVMHPDLQVIFFGIMILIVVIQLLRADPSAAPFAVGSILIAALVYVFVRPRAIRLYERNKKEAAAYRLFEQKMTRWLMLYCCIKDNGLFVKGDPQVVSFDQMQDLLQK